MKPYRKGEKRLAGISKAVDKLQKEEVELDEAFKIKKLPGYRKTVRNEVGNSIHHFNDGSKVYAAIGQSSSGRTLQYHKIKNNGEREVHSQTSLTKSFTKEEVELDAVYQETANYLVSEGIELESLNEEELNELIGAVARGIGRGIKRATVNKQGNFRFSSAGRADSVQKKADSLEKKQRDHERLQKQCERLQRLRQARNT
jgi:hypothetical protein